MKIFVLIALMLSLSIVSAFAENKTVIDYPLAAQVYLNDKAMTDLLVAKNWSTEDVLGFCGAAGPLLIEKYGTNAPLLRAIGISNQTERAHSAACFSFVELSKKMTADDVRAFAMIMGILYIDDYKNNRDPEKFDMLNPLRIVGYFHGTTKFDPPAILSAFLGFQNQPNGYPVSVVNFVGPLYHGKTAQALNVLREVAPLVQDPGIKKVVVKVANTKEEKKK